MADEKGGVEERVALDTVSGILSVGLMRVVATNLNTGAPPERGALTFERKPDGTYGVKLAYTPNGEEKNKNKSNTHA